MAFRAAALTPWLIGLALTGCGGGDSSQGPGPSVAIAKATASGDAQTGAVGAALASPIQVVVTSNGVVAAGTTVTWTATGGTVAPGSSVSGADGIAATTWTLGPTVGAQSAHAAVSGAAGSPVAFTATATVGAVASLAPTAGDQQTGDVGSTLATALQVTARDQFGNAVAGVTVAFAVGAGGGSVSPLSAMTDAQGRASTVLTLPAAPNSVTVTASTGAVQPATFHETAAPPANGSTVLVVNNQFQPAQLTVAAGTTVTFTWASTAVGHTITPEGPNTIPSDPLTHSAPHSYSVTFNTPGTYFYYCSNHGAPGSGGIPTGMSGSIVVQ